eukprot:8847087-Pyramimonas_sp.AAC.1
MRQLQRRRAGQDRIETEMTVAPHQAQRFCRHLMVLSVTGQRSRHQGFRGYLDPLAAEAVAADLRAQEGHMTREALMR